MAGRISGILTCIPGGSSPRQVRPSVGDSLTNDNSSPGVTRGRLDASISGIVYRSGEMLFQSPRDR